MKIAFLNTPVSPEDMYPILLEADEIEVFEEIWKALAFLEGTGRLYVARTKAGDYETELKVAESKGVHIVEVNPDPPADISDEDAVKEWLLIRNDSDDFNPMEELLLLDDYTDDGEDDNPEVEDEENGPSTNFRNFDMGPFVTPEPKENEIKGLNQKVQITPDMLQMEDRRKDGRTPYEPSDLGFLMLVTSGFGGGGKTTISYYSAQVMNMALKHAKNDRTQIIFIEGDYGNPKIQNRLRIPAGQDLSKLANFLDAVKRGEIPRADVNTMAEQIMEDIIYEDPSSGVKIIACPYDKSRANPPAIREALKKAVMWAQRSMGYFVVLDADTIGLAEGVELDLVEMANRVVVITNTREPKVIKKKFLWFKEEVDDANPHNRSHIDDALVMIRVFTRPISQNGFGIPGNRIRVFFNETSAEELQNKVLDRDIFPKNMVVGNLPKIPEIERAWAGDVSRNRNRAIEVAKSVAEFLLRTTEYREVDQLLKAMRAG